MNRVHWQLFPKISFPPFLAAILNFCVKRKNKFILETVQDRDFDKIFDPQGISQIARLWATIGYGWQNIASGPPLSHCWPTDCIFSKFLKHYKQLHKQPQLLFSDILFNTSQCGIYCVVHCWRTNY